MIAAAAPRKRTRTFGKHAWLSVLGGLVMAFAMTGMADAYWTASGTGSGSSPVGTLAAPTISSATNGVATATLTWTAVTPPGSGSVFYYVTRGVGNPAGNCPTSASPQPVITCIDSGLSPNTYSYTVTAVWRSWTATSASRAVTVIGPPLNTVLPVISGIAAVGQTLSTTTGTWTNSPTGYGYQWRHCDSAGSTCSDISSATSGTYTLLLADADSTIRVVVTATNPYGSTPATSAQYPAAVTVTEFPPVNINNALPVISGTAAVGNVLSTTNGDWDYSPTRYTYQWRICNGGGQQCLDISGATSSTYTLVYAAVDVGSTIRVVVTATNASGSTPAISVQTGKLP